MLKAESGRSRTLKNVCSTVRSPNTSKPGELISPSAAATNRTLSPTVTVAFAVAGSAGSLRCINTPLRSVSR
ncbi:hydrolase [Mycobacterium tuberculosis variant africanum]|nr:hydrolase [Mycobacterium tuberculosis variant africanum]SGH16982.1 Uncharacterised protein [Mycobacterium tuberculosis]SGK05878.1 Uncharacterised protein [Mycobacterium tuberculosis]